MELTDIRAEAKKAVTEWEVIWGWIPKYSFRKGLNRKRDRLLSMIEDERKDARRRVKRHFDAEIDEYYRSVLTAQEEALREQLKNLHGGETDKKTVETYQERLGFLDRCVEELKAVIGNG